jgi:hypothetical protein
VLALAGVWPKLALTQFLTTLLEKEKKIQSTSSMSDDDKPKDKGDHTDPFNQREYQELPEYLRQKIKVKFSANLQAFLASCIKEQRGKATQYREPIFGDPNASISAAPQVKTNEGVEYPYHTHVDYAKMLQDQRTITDNNLMTTVNMFMARMDRLEGKTTDYVDAYANESTSKQPQYGMPYNFYDNQSLYAAANKAKLTSLATETDKANLGGASTSMSVVTFALSSAHNTQADHGPIVNRASARYNAVLPNPPKLPESNPMLSSAHVAPTTDFKEAMHKCRYELSKSIENSLGVQIKSSMTTYHKAYSSHFDFLKAPNGWRVPEFYKFNGEDNKSTMEHISLLLAQMGEASNLDFMNVRHFPLSLTGTTFSWFTSLPVCSIS